MCNGSDKCSYSIFFIKLIRLTEVGYIKFNNTIYMFEKNIVLHLN
ncbi:hypothetical protein BN165_1090019 [Clostridioides difficile E1]|nr:hypothetical protein BN163_1170017 [Clostridioides difficile T5]CCK90759.1 hypothetical protein BN164_1060017 [Clostridioides difficile T20]CCK94430.1 hypothetical protein BN165_1090019 [Clostridioides difficile E1]CCK98418.1 hypothetical protein BN166_1410016 [Clostridioides difficile E10]